MINIIRERLEAARQDRDSLSTEEAERALGPDAYARQRLVNDATIEVLEDLERRVAHPDRYPPVADDDPAEKPVGLIAAVNGVVLGHLTGYGVKATSGETEGFTSLTLELLSRHADVAELTRMIADAQEARTRSAVEALSTRLRSSDPPCHCEVREGRPHSSFSGNPHGHRSDCPAWGFKGEHFKAREAAHDKARKVLNEAAAAADEAVLVRGEPEPVIFVHPATLEDLREVFEYLYGPRSSIPGEEGTRTTTVLGSRGERYEVRTDAAVPRGEFALRKREVPHAQATRDALERLNELTPDEARETFVRSGILTPDGQLAPEYRDDADDEVQS